MKLFPILDASALAASSVLNSALQDPRGERHSPSGRGEDSAEHRCNSQPQSALPHG